MTSLLQILLLILDIAQWIIIAHIIMSWLINFQVLNLRQQLVAQRSTSSELGTPADSTKQRGEQHE